MNTRLNKVIAFSIIFSGFSSLAAQILFIREFLIVFYGNELSIGFIFACWLFSVAIGSYLFGIISRTIEQKATLFSFCLIALSLFLPGCLILARISKSVLGFNAGEIVPLFPIAATSFVLLLPVCIFFGFIFSLSCSLYKTKIEAISGKITAVYILEAIGSGAAGIMVSFFLVRFFDSLEIITFLSILNLVLAFLLAFFSKDRRKIIPIVFSSLIFFVFLLLILTPGLKKIKLFADTFQWKGYTVIDSRNSIYGNITLAKRDAQTSFFDNGLLLYAIPDNKMQAEESVHFAMLESSNPKNVLLIGGGIGGLLKEILKYPVKHVDYLEIDPLIIQLAREYLPQNLQKCLSDKRVSIKNFDARFFVKSTAKKYDCIIIHAGSPLTAQLNRYYTVEFFTQLKGMLNKGGVVSFSLHSSENYINKELRSLLKSIYVSLTEAFADVRVIPGDTAYFVASPEKGYLTCSHKELISRLRERSIDTTYVREYYLFSRLSKEKVSYIQNVLNEKPRVIPNYDLKPRGYFYNLVFWTTNFRDSFFTRILKVADETKIVVSFLIFIVAVIIFTFARFKRANFRERVSFLSVAVTGFSAMAIQIIILLSFQIIYGYLFYKLGFILSAFMVGLVFGAYGSIKFAIFKKTIKSLTVIQFFIFIYAIILAFIVVFFINTKIQFVNTLGKNVIFTLLPAICGILAGAQFSLANKVCLKNEEDSAKVGGFTYGLDLFGSCFAAFLTAVLLIPVLGVIETCILLAGVNLLMCILLFKSVAA